MGPYRGHEKERQGTHKGANQRISQVVARARIDGNNLMNSVQGMTADTDERARQGAEANADITAGGYWVT
jgi:hypothetical protein